MEQESRGSVECADVLGREFLERSMQCQYLNSARALIEHGHPPLEVLTKVCVWLSEDLATMTDRAIVAKMKEMPRPFTVRMVGDDRVEISG